MSSQAFEALTQHNDRSRGFGTAVLELLMRKKGNVVEEPISTRTLSEETQFLLAMTRNPDMTTPPAEVIRGIAKQHHGYFEEDKADFDERHRRSNGAVYSIGIDSATDAMKLWDLDDSRSPETEDFARFMLTNFRGEARRGLQRTFDYAAKNDVSISEAQDYFQAARDRGENLDTLSSELTRSGSESHLWVS